MVMTMRVFRRNNLDSRGETTDDRDMTNARRLQLEKVHTDVCMALNLTSTHCDHQQRVCRLSRLRDAIEKRLWGRV